MKISHEVTFLNCTTFVIVQLSFALLSFVLSVRGELCGALTGAGAGDNRAVLQSRVLGVFLFKCRLKLKCQDIENPRK